jgi:hypothetical protein
MLTRAFYTLAHDRRTLCCILWYFLQRLKSSCETALIRLQKPNFNNKATYCMSYLKITECLLCSRHNKHATAQIIERSSCVHTFNSHQAFSYLSWFQKRSKCQFVLLCVVQNRPFTKIIQFTLSRNRPELCQGSCTLIYLPEPYIAHIVWALNHPFLPTRKQSLSSIRNKALFIWAVL